MPEQITHWLQRVVGLEPQTQQQLLVSTAIVLLAWLLRRVVLRIVERSSEDSRVRYQARKMSAYVAFIFAALILAWIWVEGFSSLTTFLGLLSAGVAIALKDLLVNLAAWLFILWRRPFEVGDRIAIGGYAGDVIDVRIFQFTLLEIGNWVAADQSTGRVVHIPNGRVFSEPQANYDKGFRYIWNELPVLVTFESNWRQAKEILREVVNRHEEQLSTEAQLKLREASRKFMIFYNHLTPTVYTAVRDCGVLLTLRYLCEPRRRRGSEEAIWEDILDAFAARDDIDFAYPTQRFYDHLREGKPGLVGPPVPTPEAPP